jgi:hypothetical protein
MERESMARADSTAGGFGNPALNRVTRLDSKSLMADVPHH